jgi:hypothetical protein
MTPERKTAEVERLRLLKKYTDEILRKASGRSK